MDHMILTAKAVAVTSATGQGFFVKGFASTQDLDRHGDTIPAKAFDIKTFLANPQLLFNHELFERSKDGMKVPIGVVESMSVVKVEEDGSKETFKVVDEETGETVDRFSAEDKFIVKKGDRGLWVVAKILEDDVEALVTDGRLNAFSWAGSLLRNTKGGVARIDIREVSLVFIPANARALFMIGKEFDKAQMNADYAIAENGLVSVLEENTPQKKSQEGATYAFMSTSASGVMHMTRLSTVRDLDGAIELATQMATDCAFVALFKNTWKATADGVQVFRAVGTYEGALTTQAASEFIKLHADDRPDWSKAYVDDLEDTCFAYIEMGGLPDTEGKTTPRTLRHFPYKDSEGTINPHAVKAGIIDARASAFSTPAMSALIDAAKEVNLGDWLDSDKREPLTADEQALLGVHGEKTKGGDQVQDDSKVLAAIETQFEKFNTRLDAFEKSREQDDANESDKVKEDVVTEPDTDAEKVSTGEDELMAKVASILESNFKTMNDRLTKLEQTPAPSQQAAETKATDDDEEDAVLTPASITKTLKKLDPKDRIRVQHEALSSLFGPAAERHAQV